MILYLLKTTLCLGLFLGFYFWLLEREKMHRFNRWYLLGSLLASIGIPFLPIETSFIVATPLEELGQTWQSGLSQSAATWNGFSSIGMGIYAAVAGLLLLRFVKHIGLLFSAIRSNPQVHLSGATLVLLPSLTLPHTFLNYIFLAQKTYEQQSIEAELLTHELAHVRQKHSLDILLVELLHIFFWVNPGIWVLKKAIRLNHEFLADQATLQQHKNIPAYQQLLLRASSGIPASALATPFHFSWTKKRLLMMGQTPSRKNIFWKQFLVFPFAAALMLLLANHLPTAYPKVPALPQHNTEQQEQNVEEEIPEALEKYENWLRGRRSTSQPLG